MELIVELEQYNKSKEYRLLLEKTQALNWLYIEKAVEIMRKGGMDLTLENIAEVCYMSEDEVMDSVRWFKNHKKNKKKEIPFEFDEHNSPQSKLDQVKVGILWLSNRSLPVMQARGKKSLPPEVKEEVGVQTVMALTGLGRMEILQIVEDNKEDILSTFPGFRPVWLSDNKVTRVRNSKNLHPETRVKMLRQAVMDVSNGKPRTVTAVDLEKWNGYALGIGARQIDNLLSSNESLRDLDIYRKYGSTNSKPTDKDREAAYHKMQLESKDPIDE